MVKRGLRGRAKGWPGARQGKTLGSPTINAVTVAVALGGLDQSSDFGRGEKFAGARSFFRQQVKWTGNPKIRDANLEDAAA